MSDTYDTTDEDDSAARQPRLMETQAQYSAGQAATPVTCLGLTFDNDAARRRAHFAEKLRARLQDPAFRQIEGFPIGSDEDILALSDPPYYTACPNPFIPDFIAEWDSTRPQFPVSVPQSSYVREPFAADVSEGKNDPIYNAHSYHTKVPHKAIMRYILHYTEPGDIVFDSFCGTGMTGVAAQLCGDRKAVEALGYQVQDDGTILRPEETTDEEGATKQVWTPFSHLGPRRAVLNDLSPAATFIAYNYNTPVDADAFAREAKRILTAVEAECGWMYATLHTPYAPYRGEGPTEGTTAQTLAVQLHACHSAADAQTLIAAHKERMGRINYVVWSDVFVCPQCSREIVFSDVAVDKDAGTVREVFNCPHCNAEVTKRTLARAWSNTFDRSLNQTIRQARQVPVLVNYQASKHRYEKKPDVFDLALMSYIDTLDIPYWYPTHRMPEGDEARRNDEAGITHIHHFYTQKALRVLSMAYHLTRLSSSESRLYMLFMVQQGVLGMSRLARYVPTHYSQVNQYLSGTLYIGSQIVDVCLEYILKGKIERLGYLLKHLSISGESVSTTTSSANLSNALSSSIDYIFLDPPFGANLMYSDLNFLWEAWLKVITNNKPEAVQSKTQNKGLDEYRVLMTRCFAEAFRILKPGHWMTVEFSNTQASVWNVIQTALQEAGFVVANVSILDKQQHSFKAVTTTTAVKQDLVISAYKPNGGLEERFARAGGGEGEVWDFVRAHLGYLPVTRQKGNRLENVVERDPRILYDQLVAYYVRHGYPIPLSSLEFQASLAERFVVRDSMAFLPDQAAEYDRRRLRARELGQQALFVQDEHSAIDWLRNLLNARPGTTQDILPEFMQQLNSGWKKYEARPELHDLLAQNFLRYGGEGDVPSQIHSYLSTNFKECRNLPKDDAGLRSKARDRWYVPDPNKAGDLEQLRETHLLREFDGYMQSILGDGKAETDIFGGALPRKGARSARRKLREFRLEALRAGFKRAWQARDYRTIVDIGRRLPEDVVNEDPKLLLWYGQAQARLGQ